MASQTPVPIPKLTMRETLRGFDVCSSCGVKYQWSPDGDCPNHCKNKVHDEEAEQQRQVAAEAQRLVLLRKLEAIGYSGEELRAKAREIQAQILAASFMPRPPAPTFVPVTAGTNAKGLLLANLIVAAVVFVLALFVRSLR